MIKKTTYPLNIVTISMYISSVCVSDKYLLSEYIPTQAHMMQYMFTYIKFDKYL